MTKATDDQSSAEVRPNASPLRKLGKSALPNNKDELRHILGYCVYTPNDEACEHRPCNPDDEAEIQKLLAWHESAIAERVAEALEEEREQNRITSNPNPPEDDTICTICYKWREDIPGRYLWFRRCSERCSHEHHKDEIWMAGSEAQLNQNTKEQ